MKRSIKNGTNGFVLTSPAMSCMPCSSCLDGFRGRRQVGVQLLFRVMLLSEFVQYTSSIYIYIYIYILPRRWAKRNAECIHNRRKRHQTQRKGVLGVTNRKIDRSTWWQVKKRPQVLLAEGKAFPRWGRSPRYDVKHYPIWKFQFLSAREYGVHLHCHYSQVHSDMAWKLLVVDKNSWNYVNNY